jgi:hypothetical protein
MTQGMDAGGGTMEPMCDREAGAFRGVPRPEGGNQAT